MANVIGMEREGIANGKAEGESKRADSDIETALRKLHEPPPAVQMQWTWCIRNDGSDLLKKPLTRSAAESDEVEADLFPERVVCDEDEQNCWWRSWELR